MARAREPVVVPAGRLWPNTPSGAPLDIEVFGATGEYKSGKTLLGLSIAPGAHPAGHKFEEQPRTLLLDFEKSAGTYGGTGCQRIDVPAMMIAKSNGKPYTPLQVFEGFLELVQKNLQPGQFDVLMADPITDIESGLVDYVRKRHADFGLSLDQVRKAGGFLWGAVKDYWKQVLLMLSAKVQCFYFTSHLRQVWKGNTPTSKREPKGKETLMELASLYLWLERKPDSQGKVPPRPAAIVLKERLADTVLTDGVLEIIQLVPPRLPIATAGIIREYIANPPDYSRLRVGERVIEEKMSDEERLLIERETAEAQRDTSESQLAILAKRAELRAMQHAEEVAKPQASDQTATHHAAREQDAEDKEIAAKLAAAEAEANEANRKVTEDGLCSDAQLERAKLLVRQAGWDAAKLKAVIAKVGVQKVGDMSAKHAGLLIQKLESLAVKN